jgi:ribonucleoside-diphosphate reductase alpha chain
MPERTEEIKGTVNSALFEEAKEEIIAPKNIESVEDLPEPVISTNSLTVLERRYLKKDPSGKVIETAKDMFERVARSVAEGEKIHNPKVDTDKLARKFYSMIAKFEFLPNSPTLMNAGRELGQLSACFVLPIGDSMEEIFEAIKQTALIHKSGGGTGFSFSRLRPNGDRVLNTSGTSSGPISFMKAFDAATETVKQGGTRRGANMGILRVDHPDILAFIDAKTEEKVLNNFNISVAITDVFMHALDKGADYELINPRTKEVAGKLNSREVFDKIVNNAWKNGEPGIVFIDRMNKYNPTPEVGAIESTNPCGEQPLLPYESCNLGSINLAKIVKKSAADGKATIDFDHLGDLVNDSVHFLDNVIDINKYPLPEIDKMTRSNRKIGLGVMGFADLLIKLGVPYNSEKAISIARKVMKFIDTQSKEKSRILAKERGAFPNFKGSIFDKKGEDPIRNATTTTIAPTGTISIIANSSSGIEPLFAVCYERNVMDKDIMIEIHPEFERIAKERGFYSADLMKNIAVAGSIHDFEEIPQDVKDVFTTAHDVTPKQHIALQAAFQEYTDNAVSKTINFPGEATKEEIGDAYILAYKSGLKGVTVYRDGSRSEQVLSTGKTKGASSDKETVETIYETKVKPRPRPDLVIGTTEKIPTGIGDMYITINEDPEGMNEVFVHLGKSGGEATAMNEAIGRLISLALRSRVEPKIIAKHLRGIRGSSPVWQNGELILSCPDAIGKAIGRYIDRTKKLNLEFDETPIVKDEKVQKKATFEQEHLLTQSCPDCGGQIEYEGGCYVCHGCGYSKCG